MSEGFSQPIRGTTRTPGNCSRQRRNSQALAISQLGQRMRVDNLELTVSSTLAPISGQVLLVDPGSGYTLTLPAVADLEPGDYIIIKNVDPLNTFDLDANGSETIDDSTTPITMSPYDVVWLIVGQDPAGSGNEWYRIL